jgi:hypothetical protein
MPAAASRSDAGAAMRLRIGVEAFVTSSTFPSSSALGNHQPYAPTRAGKIASQAKPVNSGVHSSEKMQINSPPRLRSTAAKRRSKCVCAINFFVLPRTRAFPFFSQGNFFLVSKNKIHFFLVDFGTGF